MIYSLFLKANVTESATNRHTSNRYENIFAAATTRERLSTTAVDRGMERGVGGTESECYINANYRLNGTVILTQGPLNDRQKDYDWHHRDFYNMIWENGSEAVVMLTNYQENGEEKCTSTCPLTDRN